MSDMWQKNSITFNISREMALDYGMVEPTPEEKVRRDAEMTTFREGQRIERVAFLVAIDALRAKGGITAKMLDLHAPDLTAEVTVECPGCDFAGGESEPPDWPCRTVKLLAEHHGIAFPSHTLPGKRYESPS